MWRTLSVSASGYQFSLVGMIFIPFESVPYVSWKGNDSVKRPYNPSIFSVELVSKVFCDCAILYLTWRGEGRGESLMFADISGRLVCFFLLNYIFGGGEGVGVGGGKPLGTPYIYCWFTISMYAWLGVSFFIIYQYSAVMKNIYIIIMITAIYHLMEGNKS